MLQRSQQASTNQVDFKRIFANAEVTGIKHFFVKKDMVAGPFTSITTSFNNLERIAG